MFMMVESLLMYTGKSYELRGYETTFSNIIIYQLNTGPSSISKLKQFQPK